MSRVAIYNIPYIRHNIDSNLTLIKAKILLNVFEQLAFSPGQFSDTCHINTKYIHK